jgi:hypothetical protein
VPGAHAPLGPSAAHRWRACPGSIAASEGLPDTAGIEAAYGTVFHHFAALVLELGLDPIDLIGAKLDVERFGTLEFTAEMATKMLPGLDLIYSLHTEGVTILMVETKVDISPWCGPDQFGTSDVIIIDFGNRRIIVFDWKWGAGVPVQPQENDQAILYGLGAWNAIDASQFDVDDFHEIKVEIIIEQPRADGGGGVWHTTMADLLAHGERIAVDAARTRDPDAPRIPGTKQCKFCPAAKHGTCREYHEFNADLIGMKFDRLETEDYYPEPVSALTPEERSAVLLNRQMIEGWLDDLHAAAYKDAEAGRPVPGMKLVEGRSPARAWTDAEKAEIVLSSRLGERAFKRELLSPAQIEEVVGKRAFNTTYKPFVSQGKPKSILVSSSHKKPAIATHGDKYDQLDTEDVI